MLPCVRVVVFLPAGYLSEFAVAKSGLAVHYQESGEAEPRLVPPFRGYSVEKCRVFAWPRELDIVPREISMVELDEFDLLDFLTVLINDLSQYHRILCYPLDPALSLLMHQGQVVGLVVSAPMVGGPRGCIEVLAELVSYRGSHYESSVINGNLGFSELSLCLF
jgi:hypothetical protein